MHRWGERVQRRSECGRVRLACTVMSQAFNLLGYKKYDIMPGAELPLFRGLEDCLNIEIVLRCLVLADLPDFIDNRIFHMNYAPMSSSRV